MEGGALEVIIGIGQQLLDDAMLFGASLLREWNIYQVLIAAALFGLAHLLRAILAPRYHEWLRRLTGVPMWRMRWLLTFHRRLRVILFVPMIWLTVLVMRAVTWPSRSYLLVILAELATAWLLIALLARLIPNGFLRGLVRFLAWAWVSLSILGLTEELRLALSSIAFDLGGSRISVWLIIEAALLIGALFAAARFVSRIAAARIQRNEDLSPSLRVLFVKITQIALFAAAVFAGLRIVGVDLTGLAVLSGAIGVGLGFGLQKVVSNLVSGVILLLDRSIKPGDVISLGETFGWINHLGARYVSITTRDGKEYLIPNEDLITGQVVNWSHSNDFVRLDIHFGTSYGDDPHKVRAIAIEAAGSVPRVLTDRPPVCHITGFGDSSVDYILRFWITDPTGGLTNIRGNVYLALWDAFQANDISIPFPQREVKVLGGTMPAVDPD
ncbi:mechanosensitive ion channel family protein [Pseudoroseicyclus sp. CXY001]|uniref:mechanosensitive ion channel family protein n=1 Tax=Pseudoroseicyclus sp. CXY001 TaxID=3242492 RepID=UPI0035711946